MHYVVPVKKLPLVVYIETYKNDCPHILKVAFSGIHGDVTPVRKFPMVVYIGKFSTS